MCSEKFPKVLKNDFKVLVKFFRNCQQFSTGTFLMTKCPKSRRIWGMSRAEKLLFPAYIYCILVIFVLFIVFLIYILYIICLNPAAGAAFLGAFLNIDMKARRRRWFFKKTYKLPPLRTRKSVRRGVLVNYRDHSSKFWSTVQVLSNFRPCVSCGSKNSRR